MAGLTVTERDKGGLRLGEYRPFQLRGRTRGGDQPDLGAAVPVERNGALEREAGVIATKCCYRSCRGLPTGNCRLLDTG